MRNVATLARAAGMKGNGEKLGTPAATVNGTEHQGNWAAPTVIDTAVGSIKIEGHFRLKGVPLKHGEAKSTRQSKKGEAVDVTIDFGQLASTVTVTGPGRQPEKSRRLVF